MSTGMYIGGHRDQLLLKYNLQPTCRKSVEQMKHTSDTSNMGDDVTWIFGTFGHGWSG
jgi:hypothetical protein